MRFSNFNSPENVFKSKENKRICILDAVRMNIYLKKKYCHIRVNDSFSNDILLASFAQAPLTYSSDNAQI